MTTPALAEEATPPGYDFVVQMTQEVMGANFTPAAIKQYDAPQQGMTSFNNSEMFNFEGGSESLMSSQSEPLIQSHIFNVANPAPNSTIGASGAFSHTAPITIPPGRAGIQPDLAFTYNSQSSSNLNVVGYGWDIPIPSIERVNKSGIEDFYADAFFTSSLSGELATTSNSALFYAKSDDGSYLEYAYATSTNTWTVEDKTGTAYTFGTASSSRQINPGDSTEIGKWMLSEIRDTNGNFVSYEYYKDSEFIYPSQITYTGNGVSEGIFTVDFSRELRPDNATSTTPGFEIESRYRLDEVTVSVDGTWVRKYELTYTNGDNDRRSLLDTIVESGQAFDTGSSVVASLPATTFDYQGATPGWATTTSSFAVPLPFREEYDEKGVRIVDYNGDALPDLIRAQQGTTTRMYANDGDEWVLDTSWTFPTYFIDEDGVDLGARFADVNGDGYVDILKSDSVTSVAYLNTGSGFATSTTWSSPLALANQLGQDTGVRLADINGDRLVDILYAVRFPQYNLGAEQVYLNTGDGWESGSEVDIPLAFMNIWYLDSEHRVTLGVVIEDVNNDGLTDLVTDDDDQIADGGVHLNTGQGTWALDTSWTVPFNIGAGGSDLGQRFADVNGDLLVDYIDGSSNRDVYINRGINWVYDSAWEFPIALDTTNGYAAYLADLDGDGLVDVVQRNESVHNRYLNRGKPVDTLVHVDQSSGSEITVAYESSANSVGNSDLPFPLQTVHQLGVDDGLGSVATTSYQYIGGDMYATSWFDSTFAGFGSMVVTDPVGNVTKTYYHQGNETATSTGEVSDSRSKIGRAYRTEVYDDGEDLYLLQVSGWERFTRGPNADFVYLATSTSLAYDGENDHRDTAESFEYSTSTGSVAERISWGEVGGDTDGTFSDEGDDKLTTSYTYAASSTSNLLLPSVETVTNQASAKVRESRNYYDSLTLGAVTKGNLTKQELLKSGSDYVDVEKTYNSYGLITEEKDPRDKTTTYAYDAFNLYPATTTNALTHVVGNGYDYSSGKANRVTNPNGRVFVTVYDPFDRPIEEQQPDLSTPTSLVTRATYSYTDTGMPRRVFKTEYLGSATSTTAYTYVNGLGKTIEERVEAEGNNTYAVRDFTYDLRRLLETESLPFFASSTAYTATSSPADSDLLISYDYDPLQRVTLVSNVFGETLTTYQEWRTTVVDPLENQKEYQKDAYGNLVEVIEHDGESQYETEYEYDGNNKLTRITDAEGNIRNFSYDGLGRRLTAEDLHYSGDGTYGTWTYSYDATGNLVSQTDPKNQTIEFTYDDLNRMLTENYTGAAGTEITYAYDNCTEGIGRLCTATSTDAVTTYAYNAHGAVAAEGKSISNTTYTTEYAYDRKGNPTIVTYPDGSEVSYLHNAAGQVEAVLQREGTGSYEEIVTDLDYAPTGKVAYKALANGVTSTYTFDPSEMYRLSRILTLASSTSEEIGGGGGMGFAYDPYENLALAPTVHFAQLFLDEVLEPPVIEPVDHSTIEEDSVASTTPDDVPSVENELEAVPLEILPETEMEPEDPQTPQSPVEPLLEEVATSTMPVIVESAGDFLVATKPGERILEGGNMETQVIGKTEDGKDLYRSAIHQKDISYLNAVTGARESIDSTLVPVESGWEMVRAPYGAHIANEWGDKAVTFRVGDLEVYFSPADAVTEKYQGSRIEPRQKEAVRYQGVFGPETAVEVHLDADTLWKETVIESAKGLESLSQEEEFVVVPFLLSSNQLVQLSLPDGRSLGKGEMLRTNESITIEGVDGTRVYVRPPVATDAEGKTTPIEIEYVQTEQGIVLKKLLPLSWLEEAVYPIRTDASVSYLPNYAGSAPLKHSGTWDTAHDASVGSYDGGMKAGSQKSGSTYYIYRQPMTFNTSGLPDTASTTIAALSIYSFSIQLDDNDSNAYLGLVQSNVASSTYTVPDDYDQIGAVNTPTLGSATAQISSMSSGNEVLFFLNATGTSWINPSGYTKLGVREGHDIADDPITSGTNLVGYEAPWWAQEKQPRLLIDYTLPTLSSPPTGLLTEGTTSPTGITDYTPEFSALFQDPDETDIGISYQVQVATSSSYWASPIWDSGQSALASSLAIGARSQDISYAGPQLTASTTYYWRIRFWDEASISAGDWSTTTASFSIADSGAHITPVYMNLSQDSWSTASDITLDRPSGTEPGDLMIAVIAHDGTFPIPPAGWTFVEGYESPPYRVGLTAYGRIADDSDVATSTYLFEDGSSDAQAGAIMRIANADLSGIVSSAVFKDDWNDIFDPGVTPPEEDTLLISMFHSSYVPVGGSHYGYSIDVEDPGTWTERLDQATDIDANHMWAIATAIRPSATTTDSFRAIRTIGTGNRGVGLLLAIPGNAAPAAPTSLEVEDQSNPTNITDRIPEFSAIYNDLDEEDYALYASIQVATSTSFANPLWSSQPLGLTASTTEGMRSEEFDYDGDELVRDTTYYWRIKFWDDTGVEGAWSEPGSFYFAISGTSNYIQDIIFNYDNAGNITRITDVSGTEAAKVVDYEYDYLYRLTSAVTSAASTTPYTHVYNYSSIGNLSSSTSSGAYIYGETGYTNPHAPTSVGGTTLGYDDNGNLTSYGTDIYGWDYRNRMASSTVSSVGTTYGYDHSGERVFKTTGGVSTIYPNQYFERENATTTKYIWAGDTIVAIVEGNGTATSTQYAHTDHLDSTTVTTDENGEVTSVADYMPFGALRVDSSEEFDPAKKFTGHELDRESNLTYAGARYYNQDVGQWISQDPASRDNPGQFLLDPQQLNFYAYARNNPLILFDPTGEKVEVASYSVTFLGMPTGGVHTYYRLTPDNPGDPALSLPAGTPSGTEQVVLSAFPEGPIYNPGRLMKNSYPNQSGARDDDVRAESRSTSQQLSAPNGMSDTDFINSFSRAYEETSTGQGYLVTGNAGGLYNGNSNNFAYTLGAKVGVTNQVSNFAKNTPGLTPGMSSLPTQTLSKQVSNYFQKQINNIQKQINKIRNSSK